MATTPAAEHGKGNGNNTTLNALCLPCHYINNASMNNKEAVLEVLKKEGTAMSAGQIAEKSGLDRKDVDKAMKELKDEGAILSPKRCYWEPKA